MFKKRFIGQNIRLISDVIERCQDSKIPGIALFRDFKKAFDSIDWSFFIQGSRNVWVWTYVIIMNQTFYANSQSCVTNNGLAKIAFLRKIS